MLVTTQTANKLIADVWFARADFAKDHRRQDRGAWCAASSTPWKSSRRTTEKQKCAKLMAEGYNIPASETIKMFADAHNTNWAENYPVLPESEQSDELRARLVAGLLPVSPQSARSRISRCRSTR